MSIFPKSAQSPEALRPPYGGRALDPIETPYAPAKMHDWARSLLPARYLLETRTDERTRALQWVAELQTRHGASRANRIASCGAAVPAIVPDTGRLGWVHQWCRDRACPACAHRRMCELGEQIRTHYDHRREQAPTSDYIFVTLTQLKAHEAFEGPGEAVSRVLTAWTKLTKRRWFQKHVAGYLRATECTYSEGHENAQHRFPGWHAHLHCAIELRDAASYVDFSAFVRRVWAELSPGISFRAQDAQFLCNTNIRQLAKYVTKPFSLPVSKAPLFFRELAGRRLLQGGGTWKDFRGKRARLPSRIVQSNVRLPELMLRAARDEYVTFEWQEKTLENKRMFCGVSVSARAILGSITKDPVPLNEQMMKKTAIHNHEEHWTFSAGCRVRSFGKPIGRGEIENEM